MGKVYVLAGVLTVLGLFGLYLLVGADGTLVMAQ